MKKGILIIVAVILMILAVIPVIDFFVVKHLIYSKENVQTYSDYLQMYQVIKGDLGMDEIDNTFFKWFGWKYQENGENSITYYALKQIINVTGGGDNELFGRDTIAMLDYFSYLVDLFLIWFILFAILQVPIFTMRLMGLDKDKGGKRL